MDSLRHAVNWLLGLVSAVVLGGTGFRIETPLREAYKAQGEYIEAQRNFIAVQDEYITHLLEQRVSLMVISIVLMVFLNILSYTGWGVRLADYVGGVLMSCRRKWRFWRGLKPSKLAQWLRAIFRRKA